jgi:hypothetical protein
MGNSLLDNVFDRRAGTTGAIILPACQDLSMEQLDIPNTEENVLGGLGGEGIVAALMEERNR